MLLHISKNVLNLKVLCCRAYKHEEIQAIVQWSLSSIEGENNRGRMDEVTNVSMVMLILCTNLNHLKTVFCI